MDSTIQTLEFGGKRFVVLEASEYELLKAAAGEGPELPPTNGKGQVNAKQFLESSIAREVIARRKKAGWTVEELARKAKVRVDVLR
jgi:hypothetical protein